MLAVLIPTILLTAVGILTLALGSALSPLLLGVLVLTMCTSGITGYILVSIFVGKGASLARVQNDFVSSVSHELRTPLAQIRMFAELLRMGWIRSAQGCTWSTSARIQCYRSRPRPGC